MKLLLDTNVLVRLCHPTGHRDVQAWFRNLLSTDGTPELLVSVLADYELRRTLLKRNAKPSMELLDKIASAVRYVPVTEETARRAAELSTTAGNGISDADVIMAAQAQLEGAVLVTSDNMIRSLPGVTAKDWDAV